MSTALYLKANVAYTDYCVILNGTTPVTGLVDANFTRRLSKDGVGNQSTTGITFSEVSAANNPGLYAINVALTSGIITTTGDFSLEWYVTATPQYHFEQAYKTTSDGTPSGTTGPASFTAIAGNGRVTDGTNPVASATVIIRTPTATTLAVLTTDASGLWGPVFFPSNGTYTAFATKSGYSQGSGTIVVSGTSATGPGTDIAMAVASSVNGQTFSDLLGYARRQARNTQGSQSDVELKQAVNEALEMLAKSERWPWYLTRAQIAVSANYSTGTLTLTNASATAVLAGGTWPTNANSGYAKLYVNGQIIRVSSTSGLNATLESAWQQTTQAGVAYVLFQDEYQLPADMYAFGSILPGTRWTNAAMATGPQAIFEMQSVANYGQRLPDMVGIVKQNLVFYPYPSQNELVGYSYFRKPAELVSPSDVADWDPAHNELLRRAIDVQLCVRYGTYAGGDAAASISRWESALAGAAPNTRESAGEPSALGSALDMGQSLWRRRQGSP
jgi:hypothetical protein